MDPCSLRWDQGLQGNKDEEVLVHSMPNWQLVSLCPLFQYMDNEFLNVFFVFVILLFFIFALYN